MILKNLDYSKNDEIDKVVSFLKKLFPNIDINEWFWEYNESPRQSHTSIFENDKKIIAHSALISFDLMCNQKIIQSSKFEGSLIDLKEILKVKDKKDRKVFQKVIKHMLEISKKNNTKFIFGFPSNQAIPSQLNAGFKILKKDIYNLTNPMNYEVSTELSKLKYHLYKSSIFVLTKYCSLLSKKNNNIYEYSGGFDNELKEFSNKYSKKNKNLITIFYSHDYITWKYLKNPIGKHQFFILKKKSKIQGIIGIKVENKKIVITDIAALNTLDIIKLIRFLFYVKIINKINLINIWLPNLNKFFLTKILLFFLGFIIQKKFTKKIIYYSDHKLITNNINSFNINKSLLR